MDGSGLLLNDAGVNQISPGVLILTVSARLFVGVNKAPNFVGGHRLPLFLENRYDVVLEALYPRVGVAAGVVLLASRNDVIAERDPDLDQLDGDDSRIIRLGQYEQEPFNEVFDSNLTRLIALNAVPPGPE